MLIDLSTSRPGPVLVRMLADQRLSDPLEHIYTPGVERVILCDAGWTSVKGQCTPFIVKTIYKVLILIFTKQVALLLENVKLNRIGGPERYLR